MNLLSSNNDYGLSTLRLWVMRVPYALTGLLFSFTAWSTLIEYWGKFEPMEGITYAFWGALSLLALLGIRFPIRMLPLLLLQFAYKMIWLAAVGYPLMARGELDQGGSELMTANLIGVVIDTIAIPWLYTFRKYGVEIFTAHAER